VHRVARVVVQGCGGRHARAHAHLLSRAGELGVVSTLSVPQKGQEGQRNVWCVCSCELRQIRDMWRARRFVCSLDDRDGRLGVWAGAKVSLLREKLQVCLVDYCSTRVAMSRLMIRLGLLAPVLTEHELFLPLTSESCSHTQTHTSELARLFNYTMSCHICISALEGLHM
jgi:hypothetical protein